MKSDRDLILAYTCYECASTLLDRDDSEDKSKARELLSEGLGIAQKLRMKPLEAKIENTLSEIDKGRPPTQLVVVLCSKSDIEIVYASLICLYPS